MIPPHMATTLVALPEPQTVDVRNPTVTVVEVGTSGGTVGREAAVPSEHPGGSGTPSQADMSAWLSRYKMALVAPIGATVLSPWCEPSPHEFVDLVGDSSSETSRILQRDHSPIRELVLSPR